MEKTNVFVFINISSTLNFYTGYLWRFLELKHTELPGTSPCSG